MAINHKGIQRVQLVAIAINPNDITIDNLRIRCDRHLRFLLLLLYACFVVQQSYQMISDSNEELAELPGFAHVE